MRSCLTRPCEDVHGGFAHGALVMGGGGTASLPSPFYLPALLLAFPLVLPDGSDCAHGVAS